ncbi:23S rRNA (guanosine(2251)-2'-O)-methyltransferase RlmB [Mycoplasmopsis pullorum]|nr:23S rRNA (guanosine(2251)-2'-O)-methyltransferase RlmB [Mycoplasmopsis pullorum]TNK83209.1 23S rRNA (guanosine(2251)-2'-O)-methyltransferase RlmB [Mycoplasmopsis pullorum]TNK84518.1 23S rRNA (guanosine(2251)-2'-O)-methyltransferase RlmB [Mycoplasmopsis pullorum]TNK85433.1 23S rRNA (guanosine(2251)-2'-O)-methyltransferase RlmB [Mycoplasmopsis pullorum]TNK85761.1 23S rRNA (guanosine(2251)-2'-O)-methyltransferase RlmB [Mycoplasmopsis pullorum]TNK86667.1 23S rRNA (guanosine(2251)-2'-O)-methyltr
MKELLMCGRNSVLDAYENNWPIEKVIVATAQNKELFKNASFKVEIVDKNLMNKMTKENHQGFIALIKPINFYDIKILNKDQPKMVLILDHIQDPQNFGAIIRGANAAGIKHIIYPNTRAADINELVLKISSGGFVGIKFIKVKSISATITWMKNNGFWIYTSALNSTAQQYDKVSYNLPFAIVVGNEGSGVSKSTLSVSDEIIYIPQSGSVQSLNVSVATGILLFEAKKTLENE